MTEKIPEATVTAAASLRNLLLRAFDLRSLAGTARDAIVYAMPRKLDPPGAHNGVHLAFCPGCPGCTACTGDNTCHGCTAGSCTACTSGCTTCTSWCTSCTGSYTFAPIPA